MVVFQQTANYQKVISRYLDNNIDIFSSELSIYSYEVYLNLRLWSDEKRQAPDPKEREKIYLAILSKSTPLLKNLHKLMVFSPVIYRSYVKIYSEVTGSLYEGLSDPIDKTSLAGKATMMDAWSRFIVFNL